MQFSEQFIHAGFDKFLSVTFKGDFFLELAFKYHRGKSHFFGYTLYTDIKGKISRRQVIVWFKNIDYDNNNFNYYEAS